MKQDNALQELLAGGSKPDEDSAGGPSGAAMSTPQEPEGDRAQADAKIALAMKLLAQALGPYGGDSDKGKVLVDMISKGQREFGAKIEAAEKLIPAELRMLMQSAEMKTPEQMAGAAPAAEGAQPMKMAA